MVRKIKNKDTATELASPDLTVIADAEVTVVVDAELTEVVNPEATVVADAGATVVADAETTVLVDVDETLLVDANKTVIAPSATTPHPAPGVAQPPDDNEGIPSIVRDRFVIEDRLGKGGMGQVFRARDLRKEEAEDDNPYIAIKFLGEEFSKHPRALISLQREAKKSQQLAHPNILTVYDFDRDGDRVYMTMELLNGAALSSWTNINFKEGCEPSIRSLIEGMASGLAYAHDFGVVHSDFKPDNVIVTVDGRVKILDFGIARIMGSAVEKDSYDAGELGALTRRYASLEMLRGNTDPHPADDIYALGIIAYQLFSGTHPFGGKTAEEAFEEGLEPQRINSIKRYQWKAIAQALQLKREDRTASADLFLRQFSGTKNRNRLFLVAIVMLVAISGFLAYRVSIPDGPIIPFEELPVAVQQEFQKNLDMGSKSAEIQDWDGASRYYIAAYDLHPRNADAELGLEALAQQLISMEKDLESTRQRKYLLQMIEAYADNEYLANHEELNQVHDRLAQALGL
ncbi:MAG: serine/threonine protein kinase [Proteobacteria bacterium]|nr:serine/threonine protein kinase [Pseudomonadota bacterium]